MSKFLRSALIVLLASISILAQAELYSWVDKNGKKHYGDKIPAEYATQAKTVEVKKGNTMQAPPNVNFYQPQRPERNQQNPQTDTQPVINQATNNCAQLQRAYEQSQECYSKCRVHDGGVNNVSACGHCTDVKRPSC